VGRPGHRQRLRRRARRRRDRVAGRCERGDRPPAGYGYFGGTLGSLGDLDGDDRDEVYISAPYTQVDEAYQGAVFVVGGADLVGHVQLAAEADQLLGSSAYSFLTATGSGGLADGSGTFLYVTSGTANGDAGVIWAVAARDLLGGGIQDPDALAEATFSGSPGDFSGTAAVIGRDVDGDGVGDVLVDAAGTGRAFGFSSPGAGAHHADDADWVWTPSRSGAWLVLRVPGDGDGDGVDDLGISEGPNADEEVGAVLLSGGSGLAGGEFGEGAAVSFLGSPTLEAVANLDEGTTLFTLEYGGAAMVEPPVGATLDPDGDADFHLFRLPGEGAFTSALWGEWFGKAGDALLIGSPASPEDAERGELIVWQKDEIAVDAYASDLRLRAVGEDPGDQAGSALAWVNDVSADGHPDLLIGAPLADGSFADSGRAYIVNSP
jgi:hypothetical protein